MTVNKKYFIPSRPEVLIELSRMMASQDLDIDAICDTLKRDVALFSAVLATVNSAYFGLVKKITSVDHAVSLLGIKRVYSIVRLTALRNSLSQLGPMERFWDTGEDVAHICALLARRFTHIPEDDAYTVGMLHDCGLPLMMHNFQQFKPFLREIKGENLSLLHRAEVEAFGTSHYELGHLMTTEWNMPEYVCKAIHHQPDYGAFLRETDEENENARILLSLLLLAKEISRKYRTYWRVQQPDIPLISDMEAPLQVLSICDYDFMDFRDDILAQLQA